MKAFTHTEVQEGAVRALKLAMKKGVAHETRQVGDDIQITTVMEKDVESKVLAVSYPDGGIDYFPTEKVTMDKHITKIRFTIEKAQLDIEDAVFEETTRLETINTELREALKAIKARIEGEWDNEALDNMLLATTSQDCLHIATEALRKTRE